MSLIIRTGVSVPAVGRLADTTLDQGALPLLDHRQLTSTIPLFFDAGNTDKLSHLGIRGDTVVLQKLYDWPKALQARDSVVFLAFDKGLSEKVYAYHPFKRRLVWSFGPQDHFPDIPDASSSDIALDGRSLLVATDQKIFLLDRRTGRLLWKTALPRQAIRQYDMAWTYFRKHQGNYLITCYDDLFIVDSRSGRLLNRIPGGEHGSPIPVASGDHVCLATRAGKNPAMKMSDTWPHIRYDTVYSVARIDFNGPSGDSVRIDRIRRMQVPPQAPVLLPFVDPNS